MEKNYCQDCGLVSKCKAMARPDQKKCKFALKSGTRNQCLYYFEDTGRCDNYQANDDARNP